ncbi:MAG: flagellar basal body-associated FliL family protein [Pseudomonadota bacterium]
MAENAEPEVEEAAPAAKLGLTQILMIVGLVIVTQVVMKFALDTFFPPQAVLPPEEGAEALEETEETPIDELEPANYLPLDPALVVNVKQQDGKSQYVQASLQLMTRSPEVFEAAKVHAPAIRSALIMLFSDVEPESLSTIEGKKTLQEDARTTTDTVLEELAGVSGVDAIYLTSLVLQ